MSNRLKVTKYTNLNTGINTTDAVLIGPIDISEWENFSILYQNSHTNVAMTNLEVHIAQDSAGATAADTAPSWIQIPTATLPQPSALGKTATVLATRIDNAYNWLRVVGKAGTSSTAGFLSITIAGTRRG